MKQNSKMMFSLGAGLLLLPLYMASAEAAQTAMAKCIAGGKSQAQCACIDALEIGSKQAIQKFVKRYGRTKTACNARAITLGISIPARAVATPAVVKSKNNRGIGNCDEGGCNGAERLDGDNPGQTKSAGGGGGGGSGGGGGGAGGGGGNGKGNNK
jgi:uncharacterized membrane protein YgcG